MKYFRPQSHFRTVTSLRTEKEKSAQFVPKNITFMDAYYIYIYIYNPSVIFFVFAPLVNH